MNVPLANKRKPRKVRAARQPAWTCDSIDACIVSMWRNRGLTPKEMAGELPGLRATPRQIRDRLCELVFPDEL